MKANGALTVSEMDSGIACVRMAKLCTKGTGVTGWCTVKAGIQRWTDIIKESSKTTNGKALVSIGLTKVMSTRVSGNMGRGVAQENFM